eukprot:695226-Rhodomonas_salina.2
MASPCVYSRPASTQHTGGNFRDSSYRRWCDTGNQGSCCSPCQDCEVNQARHKPATRDRRELMGSGVSCRFRMNRHESRKFSTSTSERGHRRRSASGSWTARAWCARWSSIVGCPGLCEKFDLSLPDAVS